MLGISTRAASRGRRQVVRGVVALSTVAAFLSSATDAGSFGTINGAGQKAEHERITRAALGCAPGAPSDNTCFEPLSLTQLAGRDGTFGAVGQPDFPPPEKFESHCDDADYLDIPGYPRSRAAATATLDECITHLQAQFTESWLRARGLLVSGRDVILTDQVAISPDCPHVPPGGQLAKCDVLLYLGRALHGVQDFYSHSNWTDDPVTGRIDRNNPPGLNRSDPPPFLDLRHILASLSVPRDLSTGCFNPEELLGGSIISCPRRVRHLIMNKDKGDIDPTTGAASSPRTPRGRLGSNFANAVRGAVADTRRQWADLRGQILSAYGPRRGQLMVCAITHDDPIRDCQGRDVAIVIDSSGSNTDTDPGFLRVTAGQQFNAGLTTAAQAGADARPDRSAVIDFDTSPRVISPLQDPSSASFAGIDAEGGTNIGSGVAAAIDVLTAGGSPVRDRAGVVVLTDGQDNSPEVLDAQLTRAETLGIRVSFGFLSPPPPPVARSRRLALQSSPSLELVRAIDATGGFFSTIDSAAAQQTFIQLVNANGVVNFNDPSGLDDDGALGNDLARTARIAAPGDVDRFSFNAERGRRIQAVITPLEGQTLAASAELVSTGENIIHTSATTGGTVTVSLRPRRSGPIELTIQSRAGTGLYTIGLTVSGVTLRGGKRADRLSCTNDATLVLARAGNDTVRCGDGDDMIDGGRGRDRLNGGRGDDIFQIKAGDGSRGGERINGGPGRDTAYFGFRRRSRTVERHGRATIVRVGRQRFVLRDVEQLQFRAR